MTLTKDQVLLIPSLVKDGHTQIEIAIYFGVSRNSINRWIRILKGKGTKVETKLGKPRTLRYLKEPPCKKTITKA